MGFFITFEGIEGSGKTTQLGLLKSYIEGKGLKALAIREPGGTWLGERVREILLDCNTKGPCPMAELFLYESARAEIVAAVIRPALGNGMIVLSDRFTDSTVAYQGYGRGLDLETIGQCNISASSGIVPDITIVLDCLPEKGLERAWKRINSIEGAKEDRFEREALEFHMRVRQGYLEIAEKEPLRVRVIDAERSEGEVFSDVAKVVDCALAGLGWYNP
ncbi:MAG: dTMP kinase [Deltaproteobacteria bacterium]|nr:dTMP kinase [Deltaproteobacteria bacterium]